MGITLLLNAVSDPLLTFWIFCSRETKNQFTCECILIGTALECNCHYIDGIMTMVASQITRLTVVYSIVYSGTDQRKHQSSASLAFVVGNSPGPVNSPHKGPVTRKMVPFDDVIILDAFQLGVSEKSPYGWLDPDSLQSGVFDLKMQDANGNVLALNDSLDVDIPGRPDAPPMSVNISDVIDVATGMVYHEINVTAANTSLIMELTPPSAMFEVCVLRMITGAWISLYRCPANERQRYIATFMGWAHIQKTPAVWVGPLFNYTQHSCEM